MLSAFSEQDPTFSMSLEHEGANDYRAGLCERALTVWTQFGAMDWTRKLPIPKKEYTPKNVARLHGRITQTTCCSRPQALFVPPHSWLG